jgi:hypothetical protein
LRTPDGSQGKQAKCPQCAAIMVIPSPVPSSGPAAAGFPSVEPAAPAQSGGAAEGTRDDGGRPGPEGGPSAPGAPGDYPRAAAGLAPEASAAFRPTWISLGDVLGRTWLVFQRCWLLCLCIWALQFLVSLGFMFAERTTIGVLRATLGPAALPLMPVGYLICLIWCIVSVWLGAGASIVLLKIARGRPTTIGDLFSAGPYVGRIVLAGLVFGLAVAAGAIVFLIPGIIVFLMFSQFYFLILDRDVGAMESLALSRELMVGNKITLLAIFLVVGIVGWLACIVTIGLGVLLVVPFLMLLNPIVYLSVSGQWAAGSGQ